MQLGPRQNWITDSTMPMIWISNTGLFIGFHANEFRVNVREHYTRQRMTKNYHMNDNNTPPFHWAKP
ncbi:MAG: hypothetical protein IAE63_04175 [Alphaproteobacteria bacterium]|nr:hypothetical protein [Alphaproteobacteria bacterium]